MSELLNMYFPWSRVVIVGGYGHVGSRLARRFVPETTVLIAGRRVCAARAVAEELGVVAGDVPVDATTGAGLADVAAPGDLIINASSDQKEAALLRGAVQLGCDYVDLGADPTSIAAMRGLDAEVTAAGVHALVGAGWAPGTSSLLARAAVDALPGAEHVDVICSLSMFDDFGPAALNWTLDSAIHPAGRMLESDVDVEPFRYSLSLEVRGLGRITAWEFGFPEQYFLPETLPIASASSWCAFQPNVVGRLLSVAARRGSVRWIMSQPCSRSALLAALKHIPGGVGSKSVGAVAIARCADRSYGVAMTSTSESDATAVSAHLQIGMWGAGDRDAGVVLPESVLAASRYVDELTASGMVFSSWGEQTSHL